MEKNLKQLNQFQLSIAEDMIDWVRVIDRDNNILYVNRKMKEDLHEDFVGKKCFEVFCKNKKCEHCISGRTLQNGSIQKKEEMLNGSTYTVISSPMYDQSGEIVGSVEVFRDVTNEKSLAKKLSEKNKKMSDDISFARNMQERMLPPKGMYNGVMTDYLYESSELLSGDFFDVFKVDNNNTAMYICDVVGHGVSASLLTIFVRQSLRTLSKDIKDVNRIMKELHRNFMTLNLDYDKYFSLFFCMYNKSTKELQYVNAGHNSLPVLLRDGEATKLEAKGYPICNIFDFVEYDVNKIRLQEKDRLFFYTDGITEAQNELGQEFGEERLINLIEKDDNILEKLSTVLKNYSKVQKDDYAILIAEII